MRLNQPLLKRHRPANIKSTTRRNGLPFWRLVVLAAFMCLLYSHAVSYLRSPQAVLVLGGATEREQFAAQFAQQHPDLPIWVSSGSNPEYSEWLFAEAGIAPERLNLDYQAVDTLTNFTTLVDTFKAQGITSLYLITSDYHMPRARVIGEIVLGSRGIAFRAIAVPSGRDPESLEKVARDAARSMLWVTTGRTGATLARYFQP